MQRLVNSAKIYRMELPFSVDDFSSVACEVVRLNKLNACYVKPIVLRGYGEVGVNPLNSPIDCYMACWSWARTSARKRSRRAWTSASALGTRIAPNTLPAMSKAAANYMNSQLIRMEASFNGYAEGIALDSHGHVQRRLRHERVPRARRRPLYSAARHQHSSRHQRATPSQKWPKTSASP